MAMAMALANPHLQSHKCFRAVHTSQPVAWEGMKKAAAYCPTGNKSRYTAFNNHPCLSSFCDMAVGPVFRVKKRCIRVLSFQDVNKKADSNESEVLTTPTQLTSYSDWYAMVEAEQSSQTLQGFLGWFANVEKQNLILQANEILQKPIVKLKSLDRDHMMKQLQEQVSQRSLKLWQSLEVRTKFSLAITLLFLLSITVKNGIQVSGELLPLWIMGPWLITNCIKLSIAFFRAYVRIGIRIAINIVQSNFVQGVVRGVSVCILRTKDFLVYAKDSIIQAPGYFRQAFETKWDYVMSGKLKNFLLEKIEERIDEITEEIRDAYLDYMEANYPNWRRTQRFLRKLFPK